MDTGELLLLLIPVIIIELGLLIFALFDLLKPDRRVKGGNKLVWAVVIVLINFFGPLIYFFFGREEG